MRHMSSDDKNYFSHSPFLITFIFLPGFGKQVPLPTSDLCIPLVLLLHRMLKIAVNYVDYLRLWVSIALHSY